MKGFFGKKSITLAFTAILIVGLLAGCGGKQSSADKSNDSEDGEVIELSLMASWVQDEPEQKAFKTRIEKFNEEHPNIRVKYEGVPANQFRVKQKTLAAGKQLPDMFRVNPGSELEPLVKAGLIMPIDEIKDYWKDLIPEDKLKPFQVDGKQYAVPGTIALTSLIYYDKDLLAKVGYKEFPTKYEDFKTMIKKLKDEDMIPITVGNKAPWVLQSVYMSTIGDRLTGSEFLPNVLSGKAKFTDESFIKGLSIIEEMNNINAFNKDMNSIEGSQARDYFIQGKAAMLIDGSWALSVLQGKLPEGRNIGLAIFPEIDGGKGNPQAISGVSQNSFSINSNLKGKKKEAALTFMKYFYSKELYEELLKANSIIAADVEVPEEANEHYKQIIQLTKNNSAPVYDATLSPELAEMVNSGLQAITLGSKTPKEVAKELQQALERQKNK
jgi:raffinose/stachyose/melibiose transport system substrate-binding protein